MKVKELLKDCTEWMPGSAYQDRAPTVSVLLPTFRRAKNGLFEKAVQSVLRQDYRNLELIIIDDCSTDGSAELIRHFMAEDGRVSCLRHTFNVGLPAISEYEGYCKAKGDYIAFIFDDDQWERDYLDKMIGYAKRTGAKAMFAVVHTRYGDGPTEYFAHGTTKEVPLSALCTINMIANGGVVLHREVIENVGLYDPHLSLTKTCDWDFWQRIVSQYEFHETGIFSGTEYGATQDDSLGNSISINRWVGAERMSQPRCISLQPSQFGSVDIMDLPANATSFYRESMQKRLQDYSKKAWYQEWGANQTVSVQNQVAPIKKRILVVADGYSATTALSFERIASQWADMVFLFATPHSVFNSEILYADAVVFMRNLVYEEIQRIIKLCESLEIPMFYYADDNFIELAKDFKQDQIIQKLKRTQTFQNLARFEGVFLSTPALVSYFEQNKLHRAPMLLEPVMGSLRFLPNFQQPEVARVTVAFMGGAFRGDIFSKMLLPALCALSQERPIRLLCPKDDSLDFRDIAAAYPKIEIVRIPRDLSLDLTLQRFGAYAPQILVHCGPDVRNNAYKTENALINATQLGAVLVASAVMPFSVAPKGVCLLAENTVEDWKRILTEAVDDLPQLMEVYQRALAYCEQRYCTAQARKAFSAAMEQIPPASLASILDRHDALYNDLVYYGGKKYHAALSAASSSRSLTEMPLSFTGGLQGVRKYHVTCTAASFSELGICFSSYGEAFGQVRIGIFCQEGQLREIVLDMQDYIRDNWTYLRMDPPIEGQQGKKLTVTLEFAYQEGSALMGVFEEVRNRTFVYKVCNKLHHPIPGNDVLFVDFQK